MTTVISHRVISEIERAGTEVEAWQAARAPSVSAKPDDDRAIPDGI